MGVRTSGSSWAANARAFTTAMQRILRVSRPNFTCFRGHSKSETIHTNARQLICATQFQHTGGAVGYDCAAAGGAVAGSETDEVREGGDAGGKGTVPATKFEGCWNGGVRYSTPAQVAALVKGQRWAYDGQNLSTQMINIHMHVIRNIHAYTCM